MKKKTQAGKIILFIVCCLVAVIMVIPFIWMLSASFKLKNEIFSVPIRWIPEVFHADNYETIMQKINFPRYFFNTAKVTIIITLLQLLTCSMAAYAFSKLHFPGRDTIFLAYLGTMMVPWHAIMIPQFIVIQKLHLYDNHLSLILTGAFSAFGVFVLRQNMLSIPDSLNEAAKIDGAGPFRIFFSIVIPLSKAILAVMALYYAVGQWNSYFNAMIFLQDETLYPLQLVLKEILIASESTVGGSGETILEQYRLANQLKYASVIVSSLPVLCLYPFVQKYFAQGVMIGSLKE